jgi:hypothetical protein
MDGRLFEHQLFEWVSAYEYNWLAAMKNDMALQ